MGLLLVVLASAPTVAMPRIAIIIDDLGDREAEGMRAADLPGPVAVALLPHRPYTRALAERADRVGKEVLLHLPLQAVDGNDLGAGAIMLDTSEDEFRRVFRSNLEAVPHVTGVNSHMGSLLTRHPGHMAWLMAEIRASAGMFFVDSYTVVESVALAFAHEAGVPATRRDVFIDTDPSPDAVAFQFDRLVALAHERGVALGIGHPYPSTLDLLERELPRLRAHGVELVRVRELIERQAATGGWVWHE